MRNAQSTAGDVGFECASGGMGRQETWEGARRSGGFLKLPHPARGSGGGFRVLPGPFPAARLAKKLRRGGSLPPGWQKKIQPVPVVVEQRLAPVPSGYRRGIIDGAFVVYEPNRGVIIDVMASFGR